MDREFSLRPILINHQPLPGERSWVKIFTYEPTEGDVLSTRGRMYAVLSVSSKVALDFSPIMQLILEDLHKEYFEKTEGGILQALERALDGIHKKLILMAQQDKRLSAGFSFNLLTAVSWGTVLYFGQLGASRACLLRKGMLFDIDEGEQKSTGLYLSSGVVQAEDRILLATQELVGAMTREELIAALMLPEVEVGQTLEKGLGKGEAAVMKSGMVLVVDIKEVPSVEDEGIVIKDSSAVGGGRRQLQQVSKGVAGIERAWQWLWKARIGPGLPLLPMLLAGGALVVLLWSIVGQGVLNGAGVGQENGQNWEGQVRANLDEAERIVGVNPDRAEDILVGVDTVLKKEAAKGGNNGAVMALQKRQRALEDMALVRSTLAVTTVAEVNVQPTQVKLVVRGGGVYVVDSQKERLVIVSDQGKVSYSASSNKYGMGALLTGVEDGLVVVSGGQGLVASGSGVLSGSTVLPAAMQPQAMTGYKGTGYVLDRTGQLYRLPLNGKEIGVVSTYFNQVLSGTDFVDVAVDGNVYLLRQQGVVEKYLNGAKQAISLERQTLLSQPIGLFSSEKSNYLYFLQSNAILVWNKDGKYIGQYVLADDKPIQMMGFDENGKRLYILSNGKIVVGEVE